MAEAAEWYRLAAEARSALAANNLGSILWGRGQFAVRRSHTRGSQIIFISVRYLTGNPPPAPPRPAGAQEAVGRFTQAVEMGSAAAAANLGAAYEDGLGAPVDLQRAAALYEQAAASGHGVRATTMPCHFLGRSLSLH